MNARTLLQYLMSSLLEGESRTLLPAGNNAGTPVVFLRRCCCSLKCDELTRLLCRDHCRRRRRCVVCTPEVFGFSCGRYLHPKAPQSTPSKGALQGRPRFKENGNIVPLSLTVERLFSSAFHNHKKTNADFLSKSCSRPPTTTGSTFS